MADLASQLRDTNHKGLLGSRLSGVIQDDSAIVGVPTMRLSYSNLKTYCRRALLLSSEARQLKLVIPCLTWSCEKCADWLRRRLLARLIPALENSPAVAFLTFTVRRFDKPATWFDRIVLGAWRRWIQAVRRDGWRGKFFRVCERHRSGVLHLHVLVTQRLPAPYLSKLWNRLLRLEITAAGEKAAEWAGTVDAKPLASSRKAVLYCAKYLTKGLTCASKDVRIRRWSAAFQWLPPVWKRKPLEDGQINDWQCRTVASALAEDFRRRYRVERQTGCLDMPMNNVSRPMNETEVKALKAELGLPTEKEFLVLSTKYARIVASLDGQPKQEATVSRETVPKNSGKGET